MRRKKSKYKHIVINKKRYYFYKIHWTDITGDAGHATAEEFDKFECAKMITFAYVYKKTKEFVWTFSSQQYYGTFHNCSPFSHAFRHFYK